MNIKVRYGGSNKVIENHVLFLCVEFVTIVWIVEILLLQKIYFSATV
jgi:hypothetical protein